MRARIVPSGVLIEPFGDPAAQAFLGGQTLAAAVAEAMGRLGIEILAADGPAPDDETLVLPDNLFLTREALRLFVAGCRGPGIFRAGLAPGPLPDYCRPLSNAEAKDGLWRYDLFLVRGRTLPSLPWQEMRAWLSREAQSVALPASVAVERLPQIRPGPPRQDLLVPRSLTLLADVRHWVHVLWLNHLLPWTRLRERWQHRAALLRWWRGRGRDPFRRAARQSIIGEGCDIHPTAWIEGCILGRGVRVSPFVFLRECLVGDGVEINEHSKLRRSVLGEKCLVLNDSYFDGCTGYPQATLANVLVRNSVFGRRVFLTSAVMFWDEPVLEPVSVVSGGVEAPTGRWQVGGCAGHGSILGTRAVFLPGRAVQNGTIVVMRPDEGTLKFPARVEPRAPYVPMGDTVLPLKQALPDFRALEVE